MGIFKFFSSRIPSKPRNKDLQTNGSVNVSVQKNVGMRTENASAIVQNVIAPENRKGKITITDLLQIPVAEIGANDTYLVYSSGSDEAGWHTGGQFEYEGELYDDGTFFLWSIDRWVAVYKDNQTEEKQPTIFNPLQKIVSLISKTYSQSSYDNLPGRVKAGIPIAEVRNYELDEAGVYQEKKESQTGSQSAETNVKTLVVPYARSYAQGGEMVYEGGVLTASDYEKLCKGGNGNVDDVQVNGASVVDNNIANIALSTYLNNYATQSWVEGKGYLTSASLNGYATQNWVNQQGFLKSVPSTYATQSWVQSNFALKTDVPTKLSDIQNDSNLYVSNIYISDISAQGSWVKYAFSVSGVDTHGVPLKAGDYLLNGTQLWRVDLIGGNTGYCINAGVQIMPTIDTSAPETPANDHVPSTKLLADQLKLVAEMFNGLANSKADKSALNNYYNKTEIDENFYNKAYLNVVFSAFATKGDIEEMCKRIVVKSSKTFSVEELKGVGEILVKPSANMQIILPNDAVAIAGDRITISVIPANNTAGVDIATQTTTLYHNSAGYITTMSVVYIGTGWRLWDVQWATM